MLKSNALNFFMLGLIFLLAACSSAEASQPAPIKEAPQVEAAAPQTEMAEKVAADQAMTETEQSLPAVEAAPAKDETAPVVAESAAMPEVAPEEEEVMKSEANAATAGPTEVQAQLLATLDDQGMPPELSNEVWLNSAPLKLADLHGKVVIVEFWTFACINCQHVVPALRAWHEKYKDEGLVIIGVHTPEFGYEGELENVKQALTDQEIRYPVAIDNDWQTWRAYNNHYWPAKYFIDKAGNLRHIAIGEGRDEQQEEIIQALLAEGTS